MVALDQRRDGVALDDALRLRRRHHAADVAPVGPEHPAFFCRQRFRLGFAVHRADVFGRVAEGRVGSVHFHLREQDAHLALRQIVFQRLLEHVADHSLAFGAENVQRVGRDFVVGAVLQRQQPDLRPVAVHQHHAPLFRQPGDGAGGLLDVLALDFGFQRLAALEQRVAAQGHNQSGFSFHDGSFKFRRVPAGSSCSARRRGRVRVRRPGWAAR